MEETRRTRCEYQRDVEEFPCYATGSGHSISSDTEENTDVLIDLIWTCRMKERL